MLIVTFLNFVFVPCRICVVTLAHTHPILQDGRTIKSINYQISNGCSRLNNKVSGKSKRVNSLNNSWCVQCVSSLTDHSAMCPNHFFSSQGGQFLTDFAPLCRITCTDETEYTIYRWDELVCLHTFHSYVLLSWSVMWISDGFQLHPGPSSWGQWEYFRNTKSLVGKGKHIHFLCYYYMHIWIPCICLSTC